MRVVVDTNVFVSGILSPLAPPGQIVELILARRVTLLVSPEILQEYREVLHRPEFGFGGSSVDEFLKFIEAYSERLTWTGPVPALPDPKDTPFLGCALQGRADFLITGNKKHFPASVCRPICVVPPSEFVREIERET